jgi:hypothetical protein
MIATGLLLGENLPKQESDDSSEIEPPLLIPYRPPDVNTKTAQPNDSEPMPYDVERLTRELERAKRNSASAEHLYKIGVLARVEVEMRALKVLRLQAELENALLVRAKADLAAHEEAKVAGTSSKTEAAPIDANLAHAIEAAHSAARRREEAEIAEAELNVARQQKLLLLGSGRKSEVAKAEKKLAELKAGRN